MKRLRQRHAALFGVSIGLISGAWAYGAVSSSVSTPHIALATADLASQMSAEPASEPPVKPAHPGALPCRGREKLVNGVCIVHTVRTVIVRSAAAPNAGSGQPAASLAPRASTAPRYAAGYAPRPVYPAPQPAANGGDHDD